jgi:hypothetical protein
MTHNDDEQPTDMDGEIRDAPPHDITSACFFWSSRYLG